MTSTELLAIVLYSTGGVFALIGPAIAAIRAVGKYRASKSEHTGTWNDPAIDSEAIRETAFRDAVWAIVEYGFVALGVVLASIASIILVVGAVAERA